MNSDLIARLRRANEYEPVGHDAWEAADALTAAQEENERLRTALNEMLADAWEEGGLSSALDRNPHRKDET